MESTPDALSDAGGDEPMQPLRDEDATATADASADPAQAEWERTQTGEGTGDTATGRDPAEIPDPADEIPAEDLPPTGAQPETQDADPAIADLGPDGEGDLSPEDL